ncbi:unnamed protein product [Cuscuta europaea]|nr:unnamed protein product [Cuscuta europaea]
MRSQASSSYVHPSRLYGHASPPFQYMAASSPPLLSPALSATAVLQRAAQVGSTYSSSSGGDDGSGDSYIRGLAGRSLNTENEAMMVPSSGFLEYSQMDRSSPAMIFDANCPSTLDFLGLESGGYGNASTSRRW